MGYFIGTWDVAVFGSGLNIGQRVMTMPGFIPCCAATNDPSNMSCNNLTKLFKLSRRAIEILWSNASVAIIILGVIGAWQGGIWYVGRVGKCRAHR